MRGFLCKNFKKEKNMDIYKIIFNQDFSALESFEKLDAKYDTAKKYFEEWDKKSEEEQKKEKPFLLVEKREKPYIVIYHKSKKGIKTHPWTKNRDKTWLADHSPWDTMSEDGWIKAVTDFIPELTNPPKKTASRSSQVKRNIPATKKSKNISNADESFLSPAKLSAMPEYSGVDELKDIYNLAKNIFDNVRNNEEINKYAVGYPILWFGNLQAYKASPLRILTVGINPSEDEFPNNTFRRFPAWNELSVGNYFKGLNEYFNEEAYDWFANLSDAISLEAVWDCSYTTSRHTNTALHIDYCTPIATNPTWDGKDINGYKLPKNIKQYLQNIQQEYFQKLLYFLNPDIIFIGGKQCNSWQHQNAMELLVSSEYTAQSPEISAMINSMTGNDGTLQIYRHELKCFKTPQDVFVITGRYWNIPFGAYSRQNLQPIMAEMKKYFFEKFKK